MSTNHPFDSILYVRPSVQRWLTSQLVSGVTPSLQPGEEIFCSILGPDVERIFSVKIPPDDTVMRLKKAIKEEKKPELDHVAADKLDIWKVRDSA